MKVQIYALALLALAAVAVAEPVCPAQNGGDTVHLANEQNCNTFYKCANGEPVLHYCPAGLEFNPALQVCDWPENAGCSSSPASEPTSRPSTTVTPASSTVADTTLAPSSTTPAASTTLAPSSTTLAASTTLVPSTTTTTEATSPSVPSSTTVAQPEASCPAQDGSGTVHLANEKNCNTFYKCANGVPVLYYCPAGLEFNPSLQVCDWPENAGCSSSPASEPTSRPSTTVAPASPTVADTTLVPSSTTAPQPEGSCPAQNGGDTVLLPNNKDCRTFFICSNGKPVLSNCPAGLEFNAVSKVCDWPENAGCSSSPASEPTSRPSTTVAPASPTVADTTLVPSSTTAAQPEGSCPAQNGEDTVLLPNNKDCRTFFICSHGKPVLFNCPANLMFNPSLKVCDWPENAGCSSSPAPEPTSQPSTTVAPASPTVADTTLVPSSTTTEATSPSVPSNTTAAQPEVSCPAQDGGDTVHLANKKNCNTFYKCANGEPVLYYCPAGLEFNPSLQVCDWPANAGCSSSSAPEPTSQPSTTVAPASPTVADTTLAPSSAKPPSSEGSDESSDSSSEESGESSGSSSEESDESSASRSKEN